MEALGKQVKYGRLRPLYLARCDCGFSFKISGNELKRGKQTRKSCINCKGKLLRCVKPGEKYDKLTVLEYIDNKTNKKMVKCICDCGNNKIIRPELLLTNKTNNCGCSPRGNYGGYKDISGVFFYRLKSNAKKRNIKYELSEEYLWKLFEKQSGLCALTGQKLSFKPKTASVDRIDSKLGYIKGNVQWVHKHVNIMKRSLTNEEFINFCKMVILHNPG